MVRGIEGAGAGVEWSNRPSSLLTEYFVAREAGASDFSLAYGG